ncbi:MAG: right-handed parallel beta-helix repeat-containing protein [Kiritimatiellae bacterium]|nr:right-handed parallel beta-helix repeat-containing protein [Kiritimatiellia bacterium]
MSRLSIGCAVAMFVSAAVPVFGATDIYVAADGDDANDGLTPATAKATFVGGYEAMTNGTPEATYGNRLVLGEGTFNLPTVTTVLSNGWKIAGSGKDKTTLKVTTKTRQFALESADTELRGFKIDFIGSTMNMKGISGSLANEPRGTFADLDVVNYYAGAPNSGGTPINITDATCTPVFTNCVFRNFTLLYRNSVFYIKRGTVLITNCSFIDGKCGTQYYTAGVVNADHDYGSVVTLRNCLFLRCTTFQDCHKSKFWTGTIRCNSKTKVQNCSLIDCKYIGDAFRRTDGDTTWIDLCSPIARDGTIVNTLIYGCRNENGELQQCKGGGKFTYSANDAALFSGTGNIQVAPGSMHFQGELDDRFIPVDGPTVNAGSTLAWMAGSTDVRGRPRINGGAPDIGCYEYYAPTTVYVAKDGDDANDGLTRASAKATIPAGYAMLDVGTQEESYGNTLVVGDGEWTSTEVGSTIVLSNGWSLVGENGRESTVFKAAAKNFVFFKSATAGTTVRGITFDFNRANVTYSAYAVANPKGTIADCEFRNGYCDVSGSGLQTFIGLTAACSPTFSGCVFRNLQNRYHGAAVLCGNLEAKNFLITDCSFIDCVGGTASDDGGGTLFFYRSVGTVRNCLFLRSIVNGAKSSAYGSNCSVVSCGVVSGNLTVDNCTFVDCKINRNSQAGAVGLSGGNTTLTVRNCLAYGCMNDAGPVGFVTNVTSGSTLVFSHCASEVDNLREYDGSILVSAANMRYRSKRRDDYTVVSGPTIDAGMSLSWHSGATDLYGRNRVIGPAVDIGCGEFDPTEPIKGMSLLVR